MNTKTNRTDEGRTRDAKVAEYDDVIFILKKEDDGVYEGSTVPPKKWAKTGNVEFRKERPAPTAVGDVEDIVKRFEEEFCWEGKQKTDLEYLDWLRATLTSHTQKIEYIKEEITRILNLELGVNSETRIALHKLEEHLQTLTKQL